jgi:hypothetical protein
VPNVHAAHAAHAAHAGSLLAAAAAAPSPGLVALGATATHTAGYLLVTAFLAVLVYERLGVGVLRRAWLNVDRLWAIALLVTAGAVAVL